MNNDWDVTNKKKHQRRNISQSIPFLSVSSFLLAATFLSTLSALIIGTCRRQPANNYYSLNLDEYNHHVVPTGNVSSATKNNSTKNNKNNEIHDGVENNKEFFTAKHATKTRTKTNTKSTIHSLRDLTPQELHPHATPTRHMVDPPPDTTPIYLVTCQTTAGPLHIAVHTSWAPIGARRFLHMVRTRYFSTKVAFMRCVRSFICQFGLAGDPSYNDEYKGKKNSLPDDPNWLPEGPSHRTNELGVKRFAKGYFAYAGSGTNSRSNQFIVALGDNERLAGGSPWEVPWGEAVGKESFETLDEIYTGYGEKGPSQARLSKEGSSEGIGRDFPELDYILSCDVVDSTD
mmetsp:Transcript_17320/g.36151  ORF Transcript_17320/g.36151 Transcript_17320/m.36151 type:complete len:345 (-) Transcript_17320:112-1146(-)